MSLENPIQKIEKVSEFIVPETEFVLDATFIDNLRKKYNCRFDGNEFKKIFESLKGEKITLPKNNYDVYDGLDRFNEQVLDVLFSQGIEEIETQEKEKVLRNIKFFVENNEDKKILLTDNFYTHLGFYRGEEKVFNILCQRHHDSNEWLFWLSTEARSQSTRRAIVEKSD